MEAPEFTTREEIARQQADRLPQMATRILLHLRPKQALEEATMNDAIELAAAEVVESGREFVQLSDDERQTILTRNYQFCAQRNTLFMKATEGRN